MNTIDKALALPDSIDIAWGWHAVNTNLLPAWWSEQREKALFKCSLENDFISSAIEKLIIYLYNLPVQVVPRNNMIASHILLANAYNEILLNSWYNHLEVFINDMLVFDKGGFLLIEDATNNYSRPLETAPVGFRHVSSLRVIISNDKEFPYHIYFRENSMEKIKVHWSRIIAIPQAPKSVDDIKIGMSFVSRALNMAKVMQSVNLVELEALGSIEASRIVWATGVNSNSLKKAFTDSQIMAASQGKLRDGNTVYIGLKDNNAKFEIMNMKRLPDGFNREMYLKTSLDMLAFVAGVDTNVFLTNDSSGTTKTASLISDLKARYKLMSWFCAKMKHELETKFLPRELMLQIGDQQQISETQAKTLVTMSRADKFLIDSGVIDERISRENNVKNGLLTPEQFAYLELANNRLPNGMPIQTIFSSNNETILNMISINGITDDICDVEGNLELAEDIIQQIKKRICEVKTKALNTISANLHMQARTALAALEWLLDAYSSVEPVVDEEIIDEEDVGENTEEEEQLQKSMEWLANTAKGRKIRGETRRCIKRLWNGQEDVKECRENLSKLLSSFDIEIPKIQLEEFLYSINTEVKLGLFYDQFEKWFINYV